MSENEKRVYLPGHDVTAISNPTPETLRPKGARLVGKVLPGESTMQDSEGVWAWGVPGAVNVDKQFLEMIRAALCDACTLMHGWHSDGTDWSEWDESVYKAAQAALKEVMDRQGAGPTEER